MTRWLISLWIAGTLALLVAQLAWTDWSFKAVERCHDEAVERLGFERVAGGDGAEMRRWPPGLRCHVADCPGWESRRDAATRRCRTGPANRTIELAATPLGWISLLGFAGLGSAGLVGLGALPFALRPYLRRGPDQISH